MSTSFGNSDPPYSGSAPSHDSPDRAARPTDRSNDESTISPVPRFLTADAARYLVDGESDNHPQPAAMPTQEPAGDIDKRLESDVKRLQAALHVAAQSRDNQRLHRGDELPSRAARAVHGYVGPGMRTPILWRPGFAVAGMLLASMVVAAITGTVAFVILPQIDDWEIAELPRLASGEPSLPEAPPLATGTQPIVNSNEAERDARPVLQQPSTPSQPAARADDRPVENGLEVAPLLLAPDKPPRPEPPAAAAEEPAPPARPELPAVAALELDPPEKPERAVIVDQEPPPPRPEPPTTAAQERAPPPRPEPPTMAVQEPAPLTRPERASESPLIRRSLPRAGMAFAAGRAGFQFADSSMRHLTAAELQKLSADRLRIARNEIFARKGRYFKDDALRSYFLQFAWYQPRAWEVPLSPVEQSNVGLIEAIEAAAVTPAAAPTRDIAVPLLAHEPGNGVTLPDPHRYYLTPEQLQDVSTDQLVIVRNEIFARRGRYFKDPALRAYFEQFPWYRPYAWEVPLSPVEQSNVDLIQSFEQSRAWRGPPM